MNNINLLNLIIVSVAVWSAIEIIHHGEIFTQLRLFLKPKLNSNHTIIRFISKLILCPFCLSVWIALLFCLTYNYIYYFIIALCISRLSNLFNDVTKTLNFCYTPTPKDQEIYTENNNNITDVK